MKYYDHTQWRNSALSSRMGLGFTSIDARAFIPILAVLLHISWTTFYIFLGAVALFSFLEYLGYSAPVAVRKLRSIIAGKRRYVQRTVARRKRFVHG